MAHSGKMRVASKLELAGDSYHKHLLAKGSIMAVSHFTCPICGRQFSETRKKKRIYCSRKCQHVGHRGFPANAGEDNGSFKHGFSDKPIHKIWTGMIGRCHNPKDKSYDNYGGRGIEVCQRWREAFINFLADVGPRPSPQHSIDRYPDNNGNYEPGNVRWATASEQQRNRRNNAMFTVNGVTQCASAWSEQTGVSISAMIRRRRIWGWSDAKSVLTPSGAIRGKGRPPKDQEIRMKVAEMLSRGMRNRDIAAQLNIPTWIITSYKRSIAV